MKRESLKSMKLPLLTFDIGCAILTLTGNYIKIGVKLNMNENYFIIHGSFGSPFGNFIEHADAFRKAVENTKFAVGKVTISVGVAVYDGGDYFHII